MAMASGMGRAGAIVDEAVSAVEQRMGVTVEPSVRDVLIGALDANTDFIASAGPSEHARAVQAATIMLGEAALLREKRGYAGKEIRVVGEAELFEVHWLWPFGKA